MAITQIHTHRRNRHGSWRNGEGGALDGRDLGPLHDGSPRGSSGGLHTSAWSTRRDLLQRSSSGAAVATRRRLGDRFAGRRPHRHREHPHEDATPSIYQRHQLRRDSRTRADAPLMRRT